MNRHDHFSTNEFLKSPQVSHHLCGITALLTAFSDAAITRIRVLLIYVLRPIQLQWSWRASTSRFRGCSSSSSVDAARWHRCRQACRCSVAAMPQCESVSWSGNRISGVSTGCLSRDVTGPSTSPPWCLNALVSVGRCRCCCWWWRCCWQLLRLSKDRGTSWWTSRKREEYSVGLISISLDI